MEAEFPRVYPYSKAESRRLGETDEWTASHAANVACCRAIDQAIGIQSAEHQLEDADIKHVIAKYGYARVGWVLSNTLQYKDYDARLDQSNKQWAHRVWIPRDINRAGRNLNTEFMMQADPAALNSFVNQYRTAVQELGIFGASQCQQDSTQENYQGHVLVLAIDNLPEEYWTPKKQLWLATGGFGCRPTASGRTIFGKNLADGTKGRFQRSDVLGIIRNDQMPAWAAAKLEELQMPQQEATQNQGMDLQM